MSNCSSIPINHTQPVKGVIFDLDGTLVTSGLNFNAIREEIGCPATTDILGFIAGLPCDTQRRAATDKVIQFEMDDAKTSQLISGVMVMLAQLRYWELPTAVVTRNCLAATRMKLQTHNLQFDTVITRECAPAKPDPAALLQISKDWQIEAKNLIYIGDYIYDIQAAQNAGMRSVYMHLGEEQRPNWHTRASWCFSDYQQLLAELVVLNGGV